MLKQNPFGQYYILVGGGYLVIHSVLRNENGRRHFNLNTWTRNFQPRKELMLAALQADRILIGMYKGRDNYEYGRG